MLKLGSHVSMGGKEMLLGSVEDAAAFGATTFMIYTGAPQNTRRKAVSEMRIDEAHARMEEENIAVEDVVLHAPYIMNLANPEPQKREFAVRFLTDEVNRATEMEVPQIVLHPGAHVKQGSDIAIGNIVDGLNKVIENTKDSSVKIALETMSGKGTEVGRTFEELRAIIDGVDKDERLSVCLDTCHVHDAGYDIKDDYEGVLKEFDRIIGLDRLSVIHVNDSKNEKGAHKDRHENIGFGHIGFERLAAIVHDARFAHLPKILETPYLTKNDEDKKRLYPPYKEEIAMLREKKFNPNLKAEIRKNHR